MIQLCPICNRDTSDLVAINFSRDLCKKHGLKGECVGIGGRELIFPFGSIQISDDCCWCDYEKIKNKLSKIKKGE